MLHKNEELAYELNRDLESIFLVSKRVFGLNWKNSLFTLFKKFGLYVTFVKDEVVEIVKLGDSNKMVLFANTKEPSVLSLIAFRKVDVALKKVSNEIINKANL